MSEIAIKLTDVSKRFKLYNNPITGPINEILFFWKRSAYYQEFKAVKNVSMEIKKGEVVGIIGPNGAGKTTLLKMIAGLLPVDKGKLEVNGKITALLALGVGINPEFTGRETIFYNGLLLGMTKEEVLRKMPQIIEFAELGDFIERPIRIYSSGMKARLLFAISMSIDPDILIVDEALATGDSYFVQKSSQRIRELCKSGATILFVSHNLSQIQQLCDRAYFMAEGRMIDEGEPARAISAYNNWVFEKEAKATIITQHTDLQMTGGTGEIVITDVKLKDANGKETKGFYSGENMNIEISYKSCLDGEIAVDLFLGFLTYDNQEYVGEINTAYYLETLGVPIKKEKFKVFGENTITLLLEPLLLLNRHYSLWLILYDGQRHYYCEYKNIRPFFVARKDNVILMRDAIFWQPCRIGSPERNS